MMRGAARRVACVAMMCAAGVCAAGVCAAGAPALLAAEPPPRTRPLRDVVVTYKMEGQALTLIPGGIQGPVRLSWDAAGQRVRAEAEGRSQVALLDLKSHAGQAFDTALRIVLPLPMREKDMQPLTMEGLRLTAKGREVVAGLGCTTYGFETAQGPGSVCLTADGVPLRGQGKVEGKPGAFTAVAVSYGALAPSLFEVPAGYISLGGAGTGAGQGPGGLAGLAQRFGGASGLPDLRSLLGHSR